MMGTITRKGFMGQAKRAVLFTLVAAGIIAASILVYEFGPPSTVYQDGMWGSYRYYPPEAQNVTPTLPEHLVLLDQHSHTIYASGQFTPRQIVQWHIAMGYNACVITDHRTIQGSVDARNIARQEYNDSIKVILGAEYTTNRIHMNIMGISDDFMQYFSANPPNAIGSPSDAEIQAFIQTVHAHDGLVVVNHIPWSLREEMDHPTREQLLAWGIDYIEIVNEFDYDNESVQFCIANGLGQITGTDAHSPGAVCSWTALNVTDFTEEAVFTEIQNHRTAVLYNASGSPYDFPGGQRNPAYLALLPLMYLGEMFEWLYDGELDWPGIAVFLAYAFSAFCIIEGVRYGRKKRAKRRNLTPTQTVLTQ